MNTGLIMLLVAYLLLGIAYVIGAIYSLCYLQYYYNKEGKLKMKTFTFTIFGRTFTIRLGRKPKEKIKMEEKEHIIPRLVRPEEYVSTVNEPDFPYERTFYACCVEYIESQRGKLADSTLRGYRNICDNHLDIIMAAIGADKLTEELIQKAFDEEIAKGLSEKTLKGYRSFVLKVLAEYRPDLKPEIRIIPWEAEPQWTVRKEEDNE